MDRLPSGPAAGGETDSGSGTVGATLVSGRPVSRLALDAATGVVDRLVDPKVLPRAELTRDAERDGRLWTRGDAETFTVGGDERTLPPALARHVGTFQRPPPTVVELREATLLWESALAVTADGRVVLETAENDRSILRHRLRSAIRERGVRRTLSDLGVVGSPSRSGRIDDPVFPLVRHPTTNFYHWLLEYLPELEARERYREATGTSPTLLVESDPPPWVEQSLELLGHGDWESWRGGRAACDCLVVGLHRSRTGGTPDGPSPGACRYLRERAMQALGGVDGGSERVFVSRRRADSRRVANVDAVEAVLREFGFETCILEALPLREQVELFARAEAVVAPHGAGLSHLAFARDPAVVELFSETDVRHHYFCLSRMLGFDYEYLLGADADGDIVVDTATLRETLERLL